MALGFVNVNGVSDDTLKNKAEKNHKHSTDDITNGILPIIRGGTGNNKGLAELAKKLETARMIQVNLSSTEVTAFDGSANITMGVTGTLPITNGGTGATTVAAARNALGLGNTSGALPIANGGTGNTTGNAATATKLKTARTVQTNLASTRSVSFDGTANITPGITGTLPIANGGTGATTATDALSKLGGFPKSGGTISGDVKITGTVAEGSSTASGWNSHAENYSTASGWCSHAEGWSTTASGDNSHAAGSGTTASGMYSYAGGYSTTANDYCSHAEGANTKASAQYQTVIGVYNKESTSRLDRFIIGDGGDEATRSNCFRVTELAGVYSNSTYKSSGADYAEMFEWQDGNVENRDRKGLFVTLDGDKIRIATSNDDYILGIVSACPSVCGDVNDDTWGSMYEKTIWGIPILEEVEVPERTEEIKTINENGEEMTEAIVVEPAHTEIRRKLNPEYDHTQQYIPRSERPEWDAVGMLGKLIAIDDGSCKENDWCTVGEGGVATISENRTHFRVMKRLDKNHIRVLIL